MRKETQTLNDNHNIKEENTTGLSSCSYTDVNRRAFETTWTPLPYCFPPVTDLCKPLSQGESHVKLIEIARKIEELFAINEIAVRVINVINGPINTKFVSEYRAGENYNSIIALTDRISVNLGLDSVEIERNYTHENCFTITVSQIDHTVTLREVLESDVFYHSPIPTVAIGKNENGTPVVCNLSEIPHLFITGQAGIGKSCCIHSIINSILFGASPDKVKLVLIDPTAEELQAYNGIPHLYVPVVNDSRKACGVLSWVAKEIDRRYNSLAQFRARNIEAYNENSKQHNSLPMPHIVVIVDGLDKMPNAFSISNALNRISSDGRRAGVHLIISSEQTQFDLATTEMISNIPGRIFFKVKYPLTERQYAIRSERIDKLSFSGDMIYSPPNNTNGVFVRGCYISKDEINRVVYHVKSANPSVYDENILNQVLDLSNSFMEQIRMQGIQKDVVNFSNSAGYQFEEYVANWLRAKGYTNVDVTPKSGDFGADIICVSPYGIKTAVQCKLQSKPVGYSAIQQVVSGKLYYECGEAMVVTNNVFTEQAKDGARKLNVHLIDRIT